MEIKVHRYNAFEMDDVKAYVDLKLTMEGVELTITNFKLKDNSNGLWLAPPQRKYFKDKNSNKPSFSNIVFIEPREKWDEFQRVALEAVNSYLKDGDDSTSNTEEKDTGF